MQFVEYKPKKYFEPLKHHQQNPRWRQNSKWRQKSYFCCQMANFQRISKNFFVFVSPISVYKTTGSWKILNKRLRRKSNKSIFGEQTDFYKTVYIFANATYFAKQQTLKCCPHTPDMPSVFVYELVSKW
jgi:hypothetical protein